MSTQERIAWYVAALFIGYFILEFIVFLTVPGPPIWRRVLKLIGKILDALFGLG